MDARNKDTWIGKITRSACTGLRYSADLHCSFCILMIQVFEAPSGKRLEIELLDLSGGLAVYGCQYGGVEIKTHKDQKLTGYRFNASHTISKSLYLMCTFKLSENFRFCAKEDVGIKLVSKRNIVPIITYNRIYFTKTILKYRIGEVFL